MSTAFARIGSDRHLQDHWLRRLIAVAIDSVLIWIVVWIIDIFIVLPSLILGIPYVFTPLDFLQGILLFLYAAILEVTWGATLGKQIMNLRVTTTDGRQATFDRTLIRNVSKINGLLLLIDTIVGMATVGDAHQKISDRFTGTTVVSTIQRTLILPAQVSPPPPSPS